MRTWRMLAAVPAACLASDGAFEPFLQWLQSHGAVLQAGLALGVDPATGLRGLLAGAAAARGDVLAKLPPALVLTSEKAEAESSTWQQCGRAGEQATEDILSRRHTALALLLLEQRPSGSPWAPWVTMLPKAFPGFPLFYSEEELAGFQASPVRRIVDLDRDAVARDHQVLSRTWRDLSLQDFLWARAAVKSRVFGLRSLSGGALPEEVIAMVPLADFVNHPPDNVVEANVAPSFDAQSGSFSLTATRPIRAGEGLYWDYGFKSNRNSLLRYGFASEARIGLTDMPLFFKLTAFPDAGESSARLKMDFIGEAQQSGALSMEEDGTVLHELALTLTAPSAERLLGHLRFMVFRPRNASALADFCPGTYCRPIGLQNERLALKQLSSVLEGLSESYSTSVDEDRQLVEGGRLEGTPWHTLLVRYGEKKLLSGFVRLLRTLDPLLDLSPWALERAVAERWNNDKSDIHRFVRRNLTALVELETLRWAKQKVKEGRARTRGAVDSS